MVLIIAPMPSDCLRLHYSNVLIRLSHVWMCLRSNDYPIPCNSSVPDTLSTRPTCYVGSYLTLIAAMIIAPLGHATHTPHTQSSHRRCWGWPSLKGTTWVPGPQPGLFYMGDSPGSSNNKHQWTLWYLFDAFLGLKIVICPKTEGNMAS